MLDGHGGAAGLVTLGDLVVFQVSSVWLDTQHQRSSKAIHGETRARSALPAKGLDPHTLGTGTQIRLRVSMRRLM